MTRLRQPAPSGAASLKKDLTRGFNSFHVKKLEYEIQNITVLTCTISNLTWFADLRFPSGQTVLILSLRIKTSEGKLYQGSCIVEDYG